MENLENQVFNAISDNDLANLKEILNIIRDKRKRTIITYKLDHDQSITLFFSGHVNINDKIYYKISRHDNIIEAFNVSAPLNLIAEDRSNFYVLGEV